MLSLAGSRELQIWVLFTWVITGLGDFSLVLVLISGHYRCCIGTLVL